jgi:hypothetical protein
LGFRWYALWRWSKYNEGNPAKPANPLSAVRWADPRP